MTPSGRVRPEGSAACGDLSVVANLGSIVRSPSDAHCVAVAAEYRPDVDGLRAVAALAVVLAHAGWFPLGGYGVDVFFVISGFLITGIIRRSIQAGTFSVADFYARRIKRIFPALLALLLAVGVAAPMLLAPDAHRRLVDDIVAGALFSENFLMYFTLPERSALSDHVLGHLWTLGIEEQYYLLWPLTLWCAWRLKVRMLPTCLVIAAVSFASFIWMVPLDLSAAWLMPWHRLWELTLGSMLACAQPGQLFTWRSEAAAGGLQVSSLPGATTARHLGIIGASLIISLALLPEDTQRPLYPLMAALGSFLLIAAGQRSWVNSRILSARPLVQIGLFSYPLYLWHGSLFMFADILCGAQSIEERATSPVLVRLGVILLSLLLAYLTYRYLEMPIRTSRYTRKIALALSVAMAGCAGAAWLTSR